MGRMHAQVAEMWPALIMRVTEPWPVVSFQVIHVRDCQVSEKVFEKVAAYQGLLL